MEGFNEPSKSDTDRSQRVLHENVALWGHVSKLASEEKYDLAISLCRERLENPLAHLPSPPTATPDELRGQGYQFLGLCLYLRSLQAIQPLSETESNEMLQALRSAIYSFTRIDHPMDQHEMSLATLYELLSKKEQTLEAIAIQERLVESLRISVKNEREEQQEDENLSTSTKKLVDALETLSYKYFEIFQTTNAVRSLQEAYQIFQQLDEKDIATETRMLALLSQMKAVAKMDGTVACAMEALRKSQDEISRLAKENESSDVQAAKRSEEMRVYWTLAIVELDRVNDPATWKEAFPNGETQKEILTEALDRAFQKSGLPANLSEGISPDFREGYPSIQTVILTSLSERVEGVEEKIRILERAIQLAMIDNATELPERLTNPGSSPSFTTHAEFLDLLLPTTNSYSFSSASTLFNTIPALAKVRLRYLEQASSSDGTISSETQIELLKTELNLGLRLADIWAGKAPGREAKKVVIVAKGQFLLLKGRLQHYLEARHNGDTESAKELWEEARRILKSVENIQVGRVDMVEEERLEELENVEKLLREC